MQEPRKSTLLFVQDAAAEPAALGAFAAEQPALALVTADGLDEAERKLAQLDPALVVWQCDVPGLPALRQCVRLAESSEAVFLLFHRVADMLSHQITGNLIHFFIISARPLSLLSLRPKVLSRAKYEKLHSLFTTASAFAIF